MTRRLDYGPLKLPILGSPTTGTAIGMTSHPVVEYPGIGSGGGGATPLPPLPTTNLLDAWLSEGISVAEPAAWTSGGGSLARPLAKTTNNPLAAVEIDGKAGGYFSSVATCCLRIAAGAVAAPYTIFVVVRNGPAATTGLATSNGVSGTPGALENVATGVARLEGGAALSSAGGSLLTDTVYLLCGVVNGGSSAIYRTDMTTALVSGNAGSTTITGFTIGGLAAGSARFAGQVCEVLLYSGASDATARGAVYDYIAARYPSIAKYTWTPYNVTGCGDSLTVGVGSSDSRGYRDQLRVLFEPLADDVEPGVRRLAFTGVVADQCLSYSANSGRSIQTMRDVIAAGVASLPAFCPILIGTNNCRDNGVTYNGPNDATAYGTMLANAYAASPSTVYRCFTVPPLIGAWAGKNAQVLDFNARLPAVIATAQGAGMDVELVDLYSAVNTGTDYDADDIHFNDAGYAVFAGLIETEIRAAA